MRTHKPLTSYRIHLDDGTSYCTNMAAGVTLAEARTYYLGARFEQPDEKTMRRVIRVEQSTPRT